MLIGSGMSSSTTMVLPAMPNFNGQFTLQPDY